MYWSLFYCSQVLDLWLILTRFLGILFRRSEEAEADDTPTGPTAPAWPIEQEDPEADDWARDVLQVDIPHVALEVPFVLTAIERLWLHIVSRVFKLVVLVALVTLIEIVSIEGGVIVGSTISIVSWIWCRSWCGIGSWSGSGIVSGISRIGLRSRSTLNIQQI